MHDFIQTISGHICSVCGQEMAYADRVCRDNDVPVYIDFDGEPF